MDASGRKTFGRSHLPGALFFYLSKRIGAYCSSGYAQSSKPKPAIATLSLRQHEPDVSGFLVSIILLSIGTPERQVPCEKGGR